MTISLTEPSSVETTKNVGKSPSFLILLNCVFVLLYRLAWEPPALSRVIKVTPTVYHAAQLYDFYRGNEIFAIKVDPLNSESKNQTNNIPVVLPRSPIKL